MVGYDADMELGGLLDLSGFHYFLGTECIVVTVFAGRDGLSRIGISWLLRE